MIENIFDMKRVLYKKYRRHHNTAHLSSNPLYLVLPIFSLLHGKRIFTYPNKDGNASTTKKPRMPYFHKVL